MAKGKGRTQRINWKPILLLIIVFVGLLFLNSYFKKQQIEKSKGIITQSNISGWNRYTNSNAGFSIDYPSDWKVIEWHSDWDTADNTNVINTAVIKKGQESQILFQWGDIGFGGGCEPENHDKLKLKADEIEICHVISSDMTSDLEGKPLSGIHESWGQIYAPEKYNVHVAAAAYSETKNSEAIKQILSTLSFY